MQIIYEFKISQKEYIERGKNNDFPELKCCPCCKNKQSTSHPRHGFYWRYVVTDVSSELIPIVRFKCFSCGKTISLLPDFLVPHFQHSLSTLVKRINQLLEDKKSCGSRQLQAFHLNRYLKFVPWIHSFFVDTGCICTFSSDGKKEAKKYMKMILDFGESLFLRKSHRHLSLSFLAN